MKQDEVKPGVTREQVIEDVLSLLEDEVIVQHAWEIVRFVAERLETLSAKQVLEELLAKFPFLAENERVVKIVNEAEPYFTEIDEVKKDVDFGLLNQQLALMEGFGINPTNVAACLRQIAGLLKTFEIESAQLEVREPGVHYGVACDGCGANPIRTVRFKCTSCHNFDLCAECEAKNEHPQDHPMIKIREPISHRFGGRFPHRARRGKHHRPEGDCAERFCRGPRRGRRSGPKEEEHTFHCPSPQSAFPPQDFEAAMQHLQQVFSGVSLNPEEKSVEKPQEPEIPVQAQEVEAEVGERFAPQLDLLSKMGYENEILNKLLLEQTNGDLTKTLEALIALSQ